MATVASREKWNRTGIELVAGQRYHYAAIGTWHDASILCDANGWTDVWRYGYVEWAKRCLAANWFQLVGSVGKASPMIVLGTGGEFVAPASGELYCFANDAEWAYGNNEGAIELTVVPA